MELKDTLGYLATILSMISLFPQIYKTYRTKSTKDISATMSVLGIFASLLWLTYGIILKAVPIIIANGIVLFNFSLLFIFKLKYR